MIWHNSAINILQLYLNNLRSSPVLLFISSTAMHTLHAVLSCPVDGAGGVLWPSTMTGSTATVGCHRFDARLRGGDVTRGCLSVTWGDLNTQQCTFTNPTNPFLLLWMRLTDSNIDDIKAATDQLRQEVITFTANCIIHCMQ